MKTYNVTKRISAQAKHEIERIINTHTTYRNSYFFHPSTNASGRRNSEDRFAKANKDVCFVKGSARIIVAMSYRESCSNVYYSLSVSIKAENESKSGNITAIKKLLH